AGGSVDPRVNGKRQRTLRDVREFGDRAQAWPAIATELRRLDGACQVLDAGGRERRDQRALTTRAVTDRAQGLSREGSMQITEVRIKLMEEGDDRLQAFCSITFDNAFVIRD